MKKHIYFVTAGLCCILGITSIANAQRAPAYAQNSGKLSKLEAISQQLQLTPQQKVKILPILKAELPKVEAIKNDNSLGKIQKVQQIRAIHQQTDPQMKAILSPAQYQKLQAIRQQAIRDATQTYGR
jgi:Spy/CpxP family protein refolding chaperone